MLYLSFLFYCLTCYCPLRIYDLLSFLSTPPAFLLYLEIRKQEFGGRGGYKAMVGVGIELV